MSINDNKEWLTIEDLSVPENTKPYWINCNLKFKNYKTAHEVIKFIKKKREEDK